MLPSIYSHASLRYGEQLAEETNKSAETIREAYISIDELRYPRLTRRKISKRLANKEKNISLRLN